MDERGQIRDSRNCLRSENISFGCGIRQWKKQSGDEVSGSGPSLLFFLARHFAAVRSALEQMERHYRSALRSIVGRLASGLREPTSAQFHRTRFRSPGRRVAIGRVLPPRNDEELPPVKRYAIHR